MSITLIVSVWSWLLKMAQKYSRASFQTKSASGHLPHGHFSCTWTTCKERFVINSFSSSCYSLPTPPPCPPPIWKTVYNKAPKVTSFLKKTFLAISYWGNENTLFLHLITINEEKTLRAVGYLKLTILFLWIPRIRSLGHSSHSKLAWARLGYLTEPWHLCLRVSAFDSWNFGLDTSIPVTPCTEDLAQPLLVLPWGHTMFQASPTV